MPRNRKMGIQMLLLRVFLPVVALAALLGAILVYNRINGTILRQFDDRLIATSALTGALIDPADHDWLISAAKAGRDPTAIEQDIRYRRNVEPMRRIRERLGLTYIYTQVTSGRAEAIPKVPRGITSVAYEPHRKLIAVGLEDGRVALFPHDASKPTIFQAAAGDVSAMVFSPDGTRLATGGLEPTVRLWDVDGALVTPARGRKRQR